MFTVSHSVAAFSQCAFMFHMFILFPCDFVQVAPNARDAIVKPYGLCHSFAPGRFKVNTIRKASAYTESIEVVLRVPALFRYCNWVVL